MIGIDRLLKLELDTTRPRHTFVRQALSGLNQRLLSFKSDQIPFFGRPRGFVINYAPNRAVRYDLNGNAVEILSREVMAGHGKVSFGRMVEDMSS
ncbi:hypothetical protein QA634_14295 [Methylobacterium sp. CB376]|uniref:hypothetical protein n=1 Tax=unclassified Methylobacterium TaxID=2615210 RepID=UPI0022401A0C|nr:MULTISPECIES: hypothetical protein [Methylobacterium]WFT82933.1 hypothetical protein QA634_14295 [Methylobacterium nodulans]